MFMGEYSHTIDAKGRLIIPAKFRDELGEDFVLTKGLDGCLSILPNNEWKDFEEKLKLYRLMIKMQGPSYVFLFPVQHNVNWTSRGEFSYRLRCGRFAGLSKDVVLTGNLTRIEIWSKEKWMENSNCEDMDAIAEGMQSMGILI